MLFTVVDAFQVPPGHTGYLAGLYRDGAYSDEWTDVSRCAENTFVGYAAACTCGWRGPVQPPTSAGRLQSRRLWTSRHIRALDVPAAGPAHATADARQ